MDFLNSNRSDWMSGVYEVEPQRAAYRWSEQDGYSIHYRPAADMDFNELGDYLLFSPINRLKLPNGSKASYRDMTRRASARKHLGIAPDVAYYNNMQGGEKTRLEKLRDVLKVCAQRSYYTKSKEAGPNEDVRHFRKLLHEVVKTRQMNQALSEQASFHDIVEAAMGMRWGMSSFANHFGWVEILRGTVRTDADMLGEQLIDLIGSIAPVRYVPGGREERLMHVEDAGLGDVLYLSSRPDAIGYAARNRWIFDKLNPVRIQAGDVIREPGVLFGPTGGRIWHAGFDISAAVAFGDCFHPPSAEDVRIAAPLLSRRQSRLLRKCLTDAEECGYDAPETSDEGARRDVHLMSNFMAHHPLQMCEVSYDEGCKWPSVGVAAIQDDEGAAIPHAAVIAVQQGRFAFDCPVCEGWSTLRENKIYYVTPRFAKSFALFGKQLPARAHIISSHLMLPHRLF